MRAFSCGNCRSLVFFENSVCVTCRSALGYLRPAGTLVNPAPSSDGSLTYLYDGVTYRPCRNLALAGCNWLAPDGAPNGLCDSCYLTRTRPADNDPTGLAEFARAETAKRRLVFQLDDLGLPVTPRSVDPHAGLAFDLLSSTHQSVITGHDSGIVTIDLAEGDDGHREALRVRLAEPYRTMLGHFRHETGHWYWDVLVDGSPSLAGFRELFGDETQDYAEALERHYASDPAPDWAKRYVSIYATAHPWEDWAETFSHYLHIRDTLQTSSAYGVSVAGPDVAVSAAADAFLHAEPADLAGHDFDKIIATWLALTLALNAVNRSMGKDDLYPFVLSPVVVEKLRFVHDLVTASVPVG